MIQAVMPKGVEHSRLLEDDFREVIRVIQAVMPKGVEHLVKWLK